MRKFIAPYPKDIYLIRLDSCMDTKPCKSAFQALSERGRVNWFVEIKSLHKFFELEFSGLEHEITVRKTESGKQWIIVYPGKEIEREGVFVKVRSLDRFFQEAIMPYDGGKIVKVYKNAIGKFFSISD